MNAVKPMRRHPAYAPAEAGYTGLLVSPHKFWPKGLQIWLCAHCCAPYSMHPRTDWVMSRPKRDNRYVSRENIRLNNTVPGEPGW